MSMRLRSDLEKFEGEFLADYAVKSGDSKGRIYEEDEHQFRSRFQRDRDRVVHSRAFRRLEYKTQVFVNHEGDYYRTRLTHSLEVAGIARTIARALGVNEDLSEVISLAHDLGHTPFGHSGEHIMTRLMSGHGGFEHNQQSFRVVTLLEDRYSEFPGLNLSYEVLEGIAKHESEYDLPNGDLFNFKGYPSIEAQLCNFADEIAYNNHDIDDGLKSGLLKLDDLSQVEIWKNHFEKVLKKYPHERLKLQLSQTVKSIINTLVHDLVDHTLKNIKEREIKTLEDVRKNGKRLVGFSDEIFKMNQDLKIFLRKNLYRQYRVVRMADKAGRVIKELFSAYEKNPEILPPDFKSQYDHEKFFYKGEKCSIQRIICDYIAGMTDRFAIEEYNKLFDPLEKV